jgi:hypothetical protein
MHRARRTRYFLEKFLRACGGREPRTAEDWKLFYHFIHAAHQGHVKWTGAEVKDLLSAEGLNADTAARLACFYEHGRELLKAKPAFSYIKLKDSNYDMDKRWDEITPPVDPRGPKGK